MFSFKQLKDMQYHEFKQYDVMQSLTKKPIIYSVSEYYYFLSGLIHPINDV